MNVGKKPTTFCKQKHWKAIKGSPECKELIIDSECSNWINDTLNDADPYYMRQHHDTMHENCIMTLMYEYESWNDKQQNLEKGKKKKFPWLCSSH